MMGRRHFGRNLSTSSTPSTWAYAVATSRARWPRR
jgi:hypothetical protein